MKTHQAKTFADAEAWDLAYWQDIGPKGRLNAYIQHPRHQEGARVLAEIIRNKHLG